MTRRQPEQSVSYGTAGYGLRPLIREDGVISCDPLYRFEKPQIQERIAATCEQIIEQMRRDAHEFVWADGIRTVEEPPR